MGASLVPLTRLEAFVLPVPFGALIRWQTRNLFGWAPESGLLQEELIEGLR